MIGRSLNGKAEEQLQRPQVGNELGKQGKQEERESGGRRKRSGSEPDPMGPCDPNSFPNSPLVCPASII